MFSRADHCKHLLHLLCYPEFMLLLLLLPQQLTLSPDVVIVKPPTVSIPIGSNGTYTVTVNNTGGGPADNTVVVEVLPPGLEYVSGPSNCTVTGAATSGQTVTCNLGSIPPSSSVDIPLVVKPIAPGPLNTTANVTADNEQNTGNNGPATTVITVVQTCDVYTSTGGRFPCGANAAFNTNYTTTASPSNATCCVS